MLMRGLNHVVDYAEDVLVHISTWEDYTRTLRELCRRLQQARYTVRPTKCVRGAKSIDFLGHRFGDGYPEQSALRTYV
ncbi:Zinc finger protein [Plakobranchus ocellatus]|uniref:Zinc finger protein n=1 Tax=Plakobranchus ocellatus TaxID=259542 RepID=A0AAV4D9I3_9GAST|nr:Zinc finger protein [Plakobranchus ocellatus]